MPSNEVAPSGARSMSEQLSAVSELLTPKADTPREEESTDVEGQVEQSTAEVPEQEAQGENLAEGADEAGSAEEARQGEIQTLMDFAKAAGWEPSELYALKMRLDTGEEVTLGGIKDKLQEHSRQQAELDAQRDALANAYAQFQEQARAATLGIQQVSVAEQQATDQINAIQARYNAIDWEKLAQTDPGRAALLQQQIAAEYAGAKQGLVHARQAREQMAGQYMQQAIHENTMKYLQAVPEWRDERVVEQEAPAIQTYLEQWFRPEELETIQDWRARVIARKAWLYDTHMAKVNEMKQGAKKVPKQVLKPGTGGHASADVRSLNGLVNRAKESRKVNDQVSAIDALLNARR